MMSDVITTTSTTEDFVPKRGNYYKVVRKPSYWDDGYEYDILNRIGKCVWYDQGHGVNLMFDGCSARLVPLDCLEKVSDDGSEVSFANAVLGNVYLVYREPEHFKGTKYHNQFRGKLGILVQSKVAGGFLKFGNDEDTRFFPYECLIDTKKHVKEKITDETLINLIKENPEGVLKIIKGLAKMNKDTILRNLVYKGVIV